MAIKHKTSHNWSSSKNNNSGTIDFAALINKQMEESKSILLSSNQQMTLRLYVM